jgi:hypothetical protein
MMHDKGMIGRRAPIAGVQNACFLASVLALSLVAGCGSHQDSGPGSQGVYPIQGEIHMTVVNPLPAGLPAGLVLTDGVESLTIAAGAANFYFPTLLRTGAKYVVSVTQSPPGLLCTVTNGSGTVTVAATDGIVVACGDASFTVGGSLHGVGFSGLVISNNGGDFLTIAQSSTSFVFPTAVPYGGVYAVSVQKQPAGETCTISSGTGTIGSAAVNNVVVSCAIAVTPLSATAAAGGTFQFHSSADAAGGSVTWLVDGVQGGSTASGTITSGGLYTAPLAAGSFKITATAGSVATTSAPAGLTVLAPHTVAVRQTTSGLAELYSRTTGNPFVARGNNYIRLAAQTTVGGGSTDYHSTFNVGLYDPAGAETALASMQSIGYNAVRVFLNGCCQGSIGDPAGGLSAGYMTNVADFLRRAQKHAIFVIFTQDWLPSQGGYDASCPTSPSSPPFESVNALNLCSGGIAAASRFHTDFVQALIQLGAPISTILAYELRNEYYYASDARPFTSSSGIVTAANGLTYDMADPAARQHLMDDGLVYLTDQLRAAIVAVDPTALVTVGFFWPQTPNPTRIGDTRVISVYPAIAQSTADFVDIHGYVIGGDLTIDQLVQNYGFVGYQQRQPVVMGEFGVFMNAATTIGEAAADLKNWQQVGCSYGIKGWLLWTWDTDDPAAGDVWNATSGDGSINQALAPQYRPDPCS